MFYSVLQWQMGQKWSVLSTCVITVSIIMLQKTFFCEFWILLLFDSPKERTEKNVTSNNNYP